MIPCNYIIYQLGECLCLSRDNCLKNVRSRSQKTNRTALHLAARHGKEECIGVLVNQGADLEAKDNDRRTPMELAAWRGHCSVIRILISLGASRDAVRRKHSNNMLHCVSYIVRHTGRTWHLKIKSIPPMCCISLECFITALIYSILLQIIKHNKSSNVASTVWKIWL